MARTATTVTQVTGLAFAALAMQRVRRARVEVNAARAMQHDAQTQLHVERARHAAEVHALRGELSVAETSHAAVVVGLRERFAVEVGVLRDAVSHARAEADRAVAASVERVEAALRGAGGSRSSRRSRVAAG